MNLKKQKRPVTQDLSGDGINVEFVSGLQLQHVDYRLSIQTFPASNSTSTCDTSKNYELNSFHVTRSIGYKTFSQANKKSQVDMIVG